MLTRLLAAAAACISFSSGAAAAGPVESIVHASMITAAATYCQTTHGHPSARGDECFATANEVFIAEADYFDLLAGKIAAECAGSDLANCVTPKVLAATRSLVRGMQKQGL